MAEKLTAEEEYRLKHGYGNYDRYHSYSMDSDVKIRDEINEKLGKIPGKIKKTVKKGISKLKKYIGKRKAYTQQVRMAKIEHEGEKRKTKKHYYPPKPWV